ncbi:hypothetical protein OIV83_004551 [Microbotryomycetes sp. JL201]|nr:hypothetical protein OIV83_004551 [Microbotryomycetes sp. JL201]
MDNVDGDERPVKRARTVSATPSPRARLLPRPQLPPASTPPRTPYRDHDSKSPSESPPAPSVTDAQLDDKLSPERRVSYYVQAVDELIDQVLANESFLFSGNELHALNRLKHGDYSSRYLFVKLYLRKDAWIRQSNIGYETDVKDVALTCQDLCREIVFTPPAQDDTDAKPHAPGSIKKEEKDSVEKNSNFIDLTGDDDDEDLDEPQVKDAAPKTRLTRSIMTVDADDDDGEGDLTRLALDKEFLLQEEDPETVLNLLTIDELVSLGKRMKVNPGRGTRREWTQALLRTSNQSMLSFGQPQAIKRGRNGRNGKENVKTGFGLSFDAKGNNIKASSMTAQQALKTIGPVIRLNPAYRSLFDRLSLVFHRTTYTANNTTSFVASLLARFGKRHYPDYVVSRTFAIFPSRQVLRQYERALAVERKIEDILGETGFSPNPGPTVSASALKEQAALRKKFPKTAEEKKLEKEKMCSDGVRLFKEVEDVWKELCRAAEVEMKAEQDDVEKRLLYYQRRFHPGWPLTRVAYKAASIYATLHDHEREVEILRALLAQTSFRRGNRGAWYDRLALVMMRYPLGQENDDALDDKRKQKLERKRKLEALDLCLTALQDPSTHLIYHSSLQRRIMRIESWLDVPKDERHIFSGALRKSNERIMQGERLDDPTTGRKSVWQAGNGAEVSVEELVLEQYVKEGWKGFHSENGILTTIFTLVFWDIIFAPVNGVFETAYQSRPLDLTTDAFAVVRRPLIDERLEAIRQGGAADFLAETDDRERPLGTFAVGVNWSRYAKQDLIEIVDCIGGPGLAPIMTMFCEDYENRVGGIPDLCIWNHSDKVCKFVEVKGPGDHLSETQKVWIDVLLSANVQVELCHVMTHEDKDEYDRRMFEKQQQKGSKRSGAKRAGRRGSSEQAAAADEEDSDY